MSMPRCSAYHARRASGSRARKKTPPTPRTDSATDQLPRAADELREDVAMRTELGDTAILAFRGVRFRHRQVRRGSDLLGDRKDPLDQRFDPGTRRNDLAPLEVDQPVGQPVADRAPQVLLDQPP